MHDAGDSSDSDQDMPAASTPSTASSDTAFAGSTDDDDDDDDDDITCIKCGRGDHADRMLLCDGNGGTCNVGCHTFCCHPPLIDVPEDDWYCESCVGDNAPLLDMASPGADVAAPATTHTSTAAEDQQQSDDEEAAAVVTYAAAGPSWRTSRPSRSTAARHRRMWKQVIQFRPHFRKYLM
jgi:hypothetical protein